MSIHLDVIIANLEIDHLVFLSTNAELNDTDPCFTGDELDRIGHARRDKV